MPRKAKPKEPLIYHRSTKCLKKDIDKTVADAGKRYLKIGLQVVAYEEFEPVYKTREDEVTLQFTCAKIKDND